MKLNNLVIQGEPNYYEFSREFINAMIDATPCEYYARLCAFVGA